MEYVYLILIFAIILAIIDLSYNKNNKEKIVSETKQVRKFIDENDFCEQNITIDFSDDIEPWIIVTHDGNELSMSLRNWNLLMKSSQKIISNSKF